MEIKKLIEQAKAKGMVKDLKTEWDNIPCDEIGYTRIDELELYTRIKNALKRNKISTIEQLKDMNIDDIANLRWIGEKGFINIMSALEKWQNGED